MRWMVQGSSNGVVLSPRCVAGIKHLNESHRWSVSWMVCIVFPEHWVLSGSLPAQHSTLRRHLICVLEVPMPNYAGFVYFACFVQSYQTNARVVNSIMPRSYSPLPFEFTMCIMSYLSKHCSWHNIVTCMSDCRRGLDW
jgi:hypothetical protein